MKREFSTAAAWSAAAAWMEQAAAALIFLVIARIIGVESFGIASMAFAFLFLGEFLVRDTITEAIIERESLEDGRLEATFFALTGIATAIMVALMGLAQVVAKLYGQPSVAPLLTTVSPAVLMIGLGGVSTALLRRRMEYKTLAIRTIVGVTLGGLVGIAMAMNGYGAWSLVGQRLAELGINSVLAILGARWWPRRLPTRAEFGLIRGLGPRVLKLRTWTLVVNQTPTVMLGIFADPRAAGLFAFSARLVEIVIKVSVRVIQGVAQSAIAELRRQTGRTSGFFLDLTELSAFAGFVSLAGLALVAFPLTRVLLGPEWDAAGHIIPFLCVAGAAMALTATQEAYLLALDRVDAYLGVIAIEAALGI
ncbi:MAG: oligosaccharide flippase family protein, partial [Albidovulum sp.]